MRATETQLRSMLEQQLGIIGALLRCGPAMLRRADDDRIDGFGSGSTETSAIGAARGVNNPTLRIAMQLAGKGDPIWDNSQRMMRMVQSALTDLQTAQVCMLQGLPVVDQPELRRESQAPACINCGELALWPDRVTPKAGRCQACFYWRRRHDGQDRQVEQAS